ncbi:MAG TPA: hypothetical protein VLS92_04315, partial [Acidimicrobiia bacterium]|nr:hypothetical protein [Acidimicrobiia bacterium]
MTLELCAAVLAAVAAVVVVCYAGRNTWFRLDVWEFLLRGHDGSVESWLRPHNAHLQIVAVVLHRLLYATVGMDFWPWYYLPHALGYAALCFFLWRVLLTRGSDRAVAFTTYVVMLFLWAAAFLSSVVVGSLVVAALLLVVAQRIDRDGEPSQGERLVVSAALLLMVASSTLGLAGLAAGLVAVVIGRRL